MSSTRLNEVSAALIKVDTNKSIIIYCGRRIAVIAFAILLPRSPKALVPLSCSQFSSPNSDCTNEVSRYTDT